MKIYRELRDPNVLHDVGAGIWFPRDETHQRYAACLAEVAAGTAQILPFEERQVEEKRRAAYEAEGITAPVMLEAIWEMMVEGRNEKATAIQARRVAIKERFPK